MNRLANPQNYELWDALGELAFYTYDVDGTKEYSLARHWLEKQTVSLFKDETTLETTTDISSDAKEFLNLCLLMGVSEALEQKILDFHKKNKK